MPIIRLLCLILFAHPALAATITLDRGPTGNREVTFIIPEPRFADGLAFAYGERPLQRQEDTSRFKSANTTFDARGLTPDGAGNAYTEISKYAAESFLNGRIFRLEGSITVGDTDRLARLAEPHLRAICPAGQNCPHSAILSLNSPGGSLAEAMRLARFIKKWSLVTVVDKGDRCESACALAFFSAFDEFEGYSGARRFAHLESRIGIHQPILALVPSDPRVANARPADLFRLANLATGEVARLFLQTGVSIGLLDRMYATPPDDMLILSPFQLISEDVRLFDDRTTPFAGDRSDLIALCANRFAARHHSLSDELIDNFQMAGDAFLTFDAGRNFLCAGHRDDGPDWRIMTCLAYDGCAFIGFVKWAYEYGEGYKETPDFEDLYIWITERGFLGFREYSHRSILLRALRDHAAQRYNSYRPLQIPASALPMPPELCGKLDEAHPALVLTVQQKLATYGFDADGADGSLGPKTRTAVQAANAQIAPNAPPGNRITPALLRAMRVPQTTIDRFTLCHPSYRD